MAAGLELSRLWPLTTRGKGAPSVKTSPFPRGIREECFLLRPPRRKRQPRGGENLLAPLPSPLRGFRGWLRGGATLKKMQLSNGVTTL